MKTPLEDEIALSPGNLAKNLCSIATAFEGETTF